MNKSVIVVGAGWAGAVAARQLTDAGVSVELYERSSVVGGHARTETLNGVVYEPNGAHIFHTSNKRTAAFVQRFGMTRPFEHAVKSIVFESEDDEHGVLLSWPPQVEELRQLRAWNTIEKELANLPTAPSGEDFETYVISMMGPTLYTLFIRDYTTKQWGRSPRELSSSFAPKRVELRNDGYRRLFKDEWEFFPARGVNSIIETLLKPVATTCGVELRVDDLEDLAMRSRAVVITAPLDEFLGRADELEWRGIRMKSRYVPAPRNGKVETAAYVVNWPSSRVAFTRTVETKHATGQDVSGTVVSEEYPGSTERHYPVPTVDHQFEKRNEQLKVEVRDRSPVPVFFCGRLANYQYINQDQAIEQGMRVAEQLLQEIGP